MNNQPSADRIEQVAFGFMKSKLLFSAIELGLFTELAKGPQDAEGILERLELHPRSVHDFLDALVVLGMLERRDEYYSNTPESAFYLDRAKSTYIGNYFQMFDVREYAFWGSLAEALKTGKPQNEIKSGEDAFDVIYATPDRLRLFLRSMTGHSLPSAMAIAGKFPWRSYSSFVDIGAAEGCCPVQIALANPHLVGGSFDLPAVRPFFEEYAASFGLQDRLSFQGGDFFKGCSAQRRRAGDGHDSARLESRNETAPIEESLRSLAQRRRFNRVRASHRRRAQEECCGVLMSLMMLIETQGGFDYTGADCCGWMRETGFKQTYVEQLTGIESMVVGIK